MSRLHRWKNTGIHTKRYFSRRIKDDTGNSMLFVLSLITVMILLGGAVTNRTIFAVRDTHWQLYRTQAFYLAEAGLQNAVWEMKEPDFSIALAGLDGQPYTADDGVFSFGNPVILGNGEYTVVMTDNEDGDGDLFTDIDGMVVINATGTVSDVSYDLGMMVLQGSGGEEESDCESRYAVLTGDDLQISGNPTIQGNYGRIHSNDDLDISGNPYVAGDATATDNYSASGNPTVVGTEGGGHALVPIPAIDPSDYASEADYFMRDNGDVEDSSGSVIATDEHRGWEYGGDKWTFGDNQKYDGAYYIEGDAVVSGNPGSSSDPWLVTIIATGSVEISGNPKIQASIPGILMVAGGDLKLNGNPNQSMVGDMLVHEQIELSGEPIINGSIVVESAENSHSFADENKISGNPPITSECSDNPSGLANMRAVITAAGPIETKGNIDIDGRDHSSAGILISNQGVLGISTVQTLNQSGNSKIGGTDSGIDYSPKKKNSVDPEVIETSADWTAEGGFPTTPDSVLGLAESTLKNMAQSGLDGSQYVTDPSNLIFPLLGVTYVELASGSTWQAIDFGNSSGILVVHNTSTDAIIKNLNGGTFSGIMIADDIVHIHNTIIGVVFALTSAPSSGNCIGNGSGDVLYSSETIDTAMQILNTPAAVSIQSWF